VRIAPIRPESERAVFDSGQFAILQGKKSQLSKNPRGDHAMKCFAGLHASPKLSSVAPDYGTTFDR
jgi:hypothetical protein